MSNRKIQAVLAQMQKNLECSICLEMMKNPISTACGHQFCRFCIMEFLERKKQVPCPLCKKTVTKRGLMEREQLGQMVSDVHRLIEAYQADTGTLFSPPRGSSMNMLPSTPEVIQPKATEMSSSKRNNVRRSSNTRAAEKRKSATPKSEERETNLTQEEGTHRVKQSKQSAGNKAQVSRGYEENPQQSTDLQRLLDVIEMGAHGADNQDTASSSRNSIIEKKLIHVLGADKKDVDSRNSINDNVRDGVTSRRKTNDEIDLHKHLNQKTDKTGKRHKQNHQIEFSEHKSDDKQKMSEANSDIDLEISPSNSNIEAMIVGENDASDHENGEYDTVKVDEHGDGKAVVNDGLTQSSVSNVSHNSSEGVVSLFRTPLDVKELKQIQANKTTIATRSQRYKSVLVANKGKVDHKDGKIDQNELSTLTPDINKEEKQVFTPELETIKTYSRKGSLDKDKSKRKVSDWLKNISNNKGEESAKIDNKSTDNATSNKEGKSKKNNQSKNMRAVQQREAVMGQRIKAFAEKVNQEDEIALFGFEGLDSSADYVEANKCIGSTTEENCLEGPTSVEQVNDGNTNNKPKELEKDKENGALESEIRDKQKATEQQDELPMNKPTQRKRIFKTKRVVVESSSVENYTNDKVNTEDSKNQNKPETVTDEALPTLKPEETDQEILTTTKKSTRLLQLSDSPITSNQSSLDPYEFKSSQKTPQKPKSKATKKKRGRATKKTNTKNKIPFRKVTKTSTVDKTEVTKPNEIMGKLEMIQKSGIGSNLGKSENKHVSKQEVNQKSGLGKNENRHDSSEIKRLAADINQAEDYDLLTCTQEALNNMTDINNKLEGKDSGASKKKVRFKEPSLADFISPGKINITLYRKEKEMYEKSAAAKDVPASLADKNSRLKGGPNGVSAFKGEREEMSTCHYKNQNQPVQQDKNEDHDDNDSDDLSEDFRFHDDSSGTDDLDINPEQDEFEPVNIESQPEEIRDQLIEEGKLTEWAANIVEPTSESKDQPAETSNLTDTTSKLQPPSHTKGQDLEKRKATGNCSKIRKTFPRDEQCYGHSPSII